MKKMELTTDQVHRNALDGFKIGIVRLGGVVSIGKLDESRYVETDTVKRPMSRRHLGEAVSPVAVMR